ncbi:MAG TPA: ATP-dependent DNA helicase RecQ, partial [Pirellulales bacterium]|nr:ATP-dependent DNA helicase RecQ [Pirellulales bacterium]
MPQPDTLQLDVDAWLPRFGLSSFRPGQRDVISAVMADEDCLCVMPTGGGKSLCYQLPAIARPGLTLVVSPLIALMKDQVDQLQALGLRATFVNSTLSPAEQQARLQQLSQGAYDLMYVVPERFRSPRFVEAVRAAGLQLLAIDEAHCISEWGHDFRPDYARLGRFRRLLGDPPTIALTATATDAVRQDIIAQLALREPRIFITGFARHNLHYAIQHHSSARRKDEALIAFLAANRGSGIVYASTRKRCEELAELIRLRTGRTSGAYHAGMTSEERHAAQDAFMQGASEIVVATTAFGMGIDKADVRFVVHYNLPGSLEGYYQEAGRAGRDGQPARCLMLFSAGDWKIQEFFIESAYPSREIVSRVYEFLRAMDADPIELTQQEIKESLNLPIGSDGIGTCEQLLEKAGVLERLEPYQNMAIVRIDSNLPTLVDLLPRQAKVQRRVM